MKKFIFIIIFLTIFTLNTLYDNDVGAALFEFKDSGRPILAGETFQIYLRLNTEDNIVNALSVEILFPTDILAFEEFSDGDSVVNFWLEKPTKNKISPLMLSGVMPGGVSVRDGLVATLHFRALKDGQAEVSVRGAQVYLHDGKGTEQPSSSKSIQLNIEKLGQSRIQNGAAQSLILDFFAPEPFVVHMFRDPNVFDGEWAVTFATQDKGSGVKGFKIRERVLGLFGSWHAAELSPYRLTHQNLLGIIDVQASDRVGRTTTARFIPKRLDVFWSASVVALIFFGIAMWRRFRSH